MAADSLVTGDSTTMMSHTFRVFTVSLFLLLLAPSCSWAQVGLQMASPRSYRTQHNNNSSSSSNSGLPYSKWSNIDNLESSLAAIFRGVAYGISTTQPTSSTTPSTTTTTSPPPPPTTRHNLTSLDVPQDDYGYQASGPSFLFPQDDLEPQIQQKAVIDQQVVKSVENLPTQTPYVEVPVNDGPEVRRSQMMGVGSGHGQEEEGVQVETGMGLRKVAWVHSLGKMWMVHVYCAAGLYSILALLALFWLARLQVATNLLPRTYCIILYLLMFLAAFLRCIHLFHDPYGVEHRLPVMLSAIAEETGWPCLTAALVVVILAVERTWRCSLLMFRRLQAPLALVLLTTAHLLVSATGHLMSSLLPLHAVPILAAARAVTTAWGGVVGVGGFVSVCWVVRTAGRHPELLIGRLSQSSLEDSLSPRRPRLALYHSSCLVQVASFLQVVMASLHMYALVGPHYLFKLPPVYPWHWLAYQSACHLLEVLMWLLLGVASVLTVDRSSKKNRNTTDGKLFALFFKRCGSCLRVEAQDKVEEVFPTICQRNQAVRNFTLQCYGKSSVYQEALMHEPSPRHANTLHVSHKRSSSLPKSATLRSANSDIHLLWDHGRNWSAVTGSDASCRLSSMLFSDTGFACFRVQTEPTQDLEEVFLKTLPNFDDKAETAQQQEVSKDNLQAYNPTFSFHDAEPDTNSSPTQQKQFTGQPDHFDRHQFQFLPQNNIYSDIHCEQYEDSQNRNEVATMTNYSTTTAAAVAHCPLPVTDNDCFKDTSTCSTISAANSFDIHMYNDLDVSCCQSPSLLSSNRNSYVSQEASCVTVSCQRPVHDNYNTDVHDSKTRQVGEHLVTLQAPNTFLTSPKSDSRGDSQTDGLHLDPTSTGGNHNFHHHSANNNKALSHVVEWQHNDNQHFTAHTNTLGFPVGENHAGGTGRGTLDCRTPASVHHIHQPPLSCPSFFTHTAKNPQHSSSSGGYPITNKEGVCINPLQHQELDFRQAQHNNAIHQQRLTRDRREKIQSYLRRPRRILREDVTAPVNIPFCHNNQPHIGEQHPRLSKVSADNRHPGQGWRSNLDSLGVALRMTPMELHEWPSPASSRPTSSYASHSDLPSECVDSEDEISGGSRYSESPVAIEPIPVLPAVPTSPPSTYTTTLE